MSSILFFLQSGFQVKESEMLAIIYSLMQLDYMDTKLVNTMEKLIKHKGCKVSVLVAYDWEQKYMIIWFKELVSESSNLILLTI